ncbi:MAG: hypothetical protein QM715_08300 [Nibricoccus sp.]
MKFTLVHFIVFASTTAGYAQSNLWQNSGNIGIGTTIPVSGRLHIDSASVNFPAIYLTGNGPGWGSGIQFSNTAVGGRTFGIYVDGSGESKWHFADNLACADRLLIDAAGRIGIGASAPTASLHILGPTTGTNIPVIYADKCYGSPGDTGTSLRVNLNSGQGGGYFSGYSGELAITHNAEYISGNGWIARDSNSGQVSFSAGNLAISTNIGLTIGSAYTPSIRMFIQGSNGNVGIGTTSPSEKLSVNGRIRAREVVVETSNWSDYVFADSYRLRPLAEVEQHIKMEKHLPGVPSAKDVTANGVSLGDMQAILLAKIEEITLHQIAQEKELASLRAEVTTLKTENSQLKARSQ